MPYTGALLMSTYKNNFLWRIKKIILWDSHRKIGHNIVYGKCPKTLYTKMSDNIAYANSVDPDQPGDV